MLSSSDFFKNPIFRDKQGKLRTCDRIVANPMWNQDWFAESAKLEAVIYANLKGLGYPSTRFAHLSIPSTHRDNLSIWRAGFDMSAEPVDPIDANPRSSKNPR